MSKEGGGRQIARRICEPSRHGEEGGVARLKCASI